MINSIEDAQKYAKRLAKAIWSDNRDMNLEDLESEAIIGFLKAQERFERPPRDFDKYAKSYMRGEIKKFITREAKAKGWVEPSHANTKRCKRCKEQIPRKASKYKQRKYCDKHKKHRIPQINKKPLYIKQILERRRLLRERRKNAVS